MRNTKILFNDSTLLNYLKKTELIKVMSGFNKITYDLISEVLPFTFSYSLLPVCFFFIFNFTLFCLFSLSTVFFFSHSFPSFIFTLLSYSLSLFPSPPFVSHLSSPHLVLVHKKQENHHRFVTEMQVEYTLIFLDGLPQRQ